MFIEIDKPTIQPTRSFRGTEVREALDHIHGYELTAIVVEGEILVWSDSKGWIRPTEGR